MRLAFTLLVVFPATLIAQPPPPSSPPLEEAPSVTLMPLTRNEVRARVLGHLYGAISVGEEAPTDIGSLAFYKNGMAIRLGSLAGTQVSFFDIISNKILFRGNKAAKSGYAFYHDVTGELYICRIVAGKEGPRVKAHLIKAPPLPKDLLRRRGYKL